MTAPDFEAWCRRGEQIDAGLFAGRASEAAPSYLEMLDAMMRSGRVDAFLVSKATLGLLYARIFERNIPAAHALWLGKAPPAAELWIAAVEAKQTSASDSACYAIVSAFFFSMSAGDPAQALGGVKQHLEPALEWAARARDAEIACAVASNWWLHLREIFENRVPPAEQQYFQQQVLRIGLGGNFWREQLWLPRLGPWRIDWNPGATAARFGPDGVREVPDPAAGKPR